MIQRHELPQPNNETRCNKITSDDVAVPVLSSLSPRVTLIIPTAPKATAKERAANEILHVARSSNLPQYVPTVHSSHCIHAGAMASHSVHYSWASAHRIFKSPTGCNLYASASLEN